MGIYIDREGERVGPFDDAAVRQGLADGKFAPGDLAWREGMADWAPLAGLFPPAGRPPPLPTPGRRGQAPEDDFGTRLLLPVGRSGWAIAAGYLGLFSMIIFPAPISLLISIIAIVDIRRSRHLPRPKYGMGRAIFGLVMGLLGTGLLALIIITNILRHAGNR